MNRKTVDRQISTTQLGSPAGWWLRVGYDWQQAINRKGRKGKVRKRKM